MADRIQRITEAHVLKLWRIEQQAKSDAQDAYDKLRARVNASAIGAFFDALNQAGREIIGKRGQEAVKEGNRFANEIMGKGAARATMADLGGTVEDFVVELEEHTRHVKALIAIRSARMARKGMSVQSVSAVLLEDFDTGGEFFRFLGNSVKRAVGSAVQQLGHDAYFAALRGKR